MIKVAVLGAGVNGLTCALKIKEKYKEFQVVLISKDFTPNTIGDGSGGLWYPYLCGDTPGEKLADWGGATYRFLHELWLEGGQNVSAMPIYELYRNSSGKPKPEWAETVFGYRDLEKKQLEYLSKLYSAEYSAGHMFTTFIVPAASLLSYLYQRFKRAGGEVMEANIMTLRDQVLDEFQVIVNCTGISARNLVPDTKVFPIRGQVSKVIAPWINETVVDEDGGNYIIPNAETCILGGTHQEHDYNTEVNDNDTDFILSGCKQMVPGLKYANVVSHWAGLRPGRDEIRLDYEENNGKLFIHNYGHGGSGLTLFWGCATDVLQILETRLKIALVQLAVGPDKTKNIAAAIQEIHKAKDNGANLVALPECFNSPYGTKYFEEYAEEVPSGETSRALSKAAAEAGVFVVGGTVPEKCGNKLYNTCTVWDESGKLLAQRRKMHLFDVDIPNQITFKESDVLSAGDQITTFDYHGIKIGLGICYDLRFPEMAHIMAKEGCSLLIYPGAFNMTTGPKHWELLAKSRANDQQLWVALVSPARDESASYVAWGHSLVVDPWAAVVGQLDEKPGVLYADIDLDTVEKVRSQIPIRS